MADFRCSCGGYVTQAEIPKSEGMSNWGYTYSLHCISCGRHLIALVSLHDNLAGMWANYCAKMDAQKEVQNGGTQSDGGGCGGFDNCDRDVVRD